MAAQQLCSSRETYKKDGSFDKHSFLEALQHFEDQQRKKKSGSAKTLDLSHTSICLLSGGV